MLIGSPRWGTFPKTEEAKSLAMRMKESGYRTAVAGKWQLTLMKNDLDQPKRMGFDQWSLFGWHEGPRYHDPMIYQNGELRTDTQGKYGPDMYVDFLIDFIRQPSDKPFFAFYSMALCHDVTDDIGKPVPYGPQGRWMSYEEMAHDMDHQVGRLMKSLSDNKLTDSTMVVFTTDNGTAGASYLRFEDGRFVRPKVVSKFQGAEIRGGKGKLNDWGTRVPLIVSWPSKIGRGSTTNYLVDFADFLPTFVEVATGHAPQIEGSFGASFLPHLVGKRHDARAWILSEHRGKFWVRNMQQKLYSDGRLVDVSDDSHETTVGKPVDQSSNELYSALRGIEARLGK